MPTTCLPDRRVVAVTGSDRTQFLQGLVSNDVTLAWAGKAVWAAFLTPQGRYLADFFIFADGERLLLDVWDAHAEMLVSRLSRFKLRADVNLAVTDLHVSAGWAEAQRADKGVVAADPRLPEAGWRAISEHAEPSDQYAAYEAHRIALGLPEPVDCKPEQTLLLEANFDWLHGVSWTKGCYMGQELTARTHYRALLRRRLVPVRSETPLPPFGTTITSEGKDVGELRSVSDKSGLAFLRREAWNAPLTCATQSLDVHLPEWFEEKP
ncbi:CAF17-like 4Fe-4S cluster assembly/insertion protein YgfZ [Brytella acorum]|uniref:Folate-binding protein n=1 Tax=Brytella acorum TaxID=2959299 RepID=A0AA35XWR3_9PROT|nr:folate-binding protein [Brytella acorum]MDF3624283.1 folate-binding protein [Brytella acorum]CAI9121143.1 folate-binding protein [Brytella acorum]